MKTVIFDFDGTLANSLETAAKVYNEIAKEKGYQQVTEKNTGYLRNLSAAKIMSELGVRLFDLPQIAIRVRQGLRKSVSLWKSQDGVGDVVHELKKQGYTLIVLTSNSKENVHQFLREHGLDVFDDIHTGSSIFGKARLLKQIIRARQLNPSETVYVGDEIRDIEAAKKAGMNIISVSWGLNSKEGLGKYKPDMLADKPSDILAFLADH